VALELLKILSLASTSFIEEQHQTAYFMFNTVLMVLAYKKMAQIGQEFIKDEEDELSKREYKRMKSLCLQRKYLWTTMKDLFALLAILRISRAWNQVSFKKLTFF